MPAIIEQLVQLTHDEKIELLVALKSALADEIAGTSFPGPDRCPRCGCDQFVKKGKDVDGTQRMLCRGCARTFSVKTMGLLARSKLSSATWMAFAECMVDTVPLRETARRIGVSLYTAWFMRMRACEVMGRRLVPCRAGRFEIDETYFPLSLPGNHSKSEYFELGREPYRTGHDARRGRRGHGGGINVVCGVNELGDCFCELADKGTIAAAEVMVVAGACIPKGSLIRTDGHPSYNARTLEGFTHEVVDSLDLDMVNSLHSRLKAFIGRFNGTSVRRLQRYLDWFRYREQFKHGDADPRELLYSHETSAIYTSTRRVAHVEDHPFMSCWNRYSIGEYYGYMSMVV